MKRHILLVVLRLILAYLILGITFGHPIWAEFCRDREIRAALMIFGLTGLSGTVLIIVLGSIMQFILRKRPSRHSVFGDFGLFLAVVILLVLMGTKLKDSKPHLNKTAPPVGALMLKFQR